MLSHYRIPPSSNTHRRKQKSQNHTEHDLKMTSYDLKVTANNLKATSNEPVKERRLKIKGGDPSFNQNKGRDFIEKAFCSQ